MTGGISVGAAGAGATFLRLIGARLAAGFAAAWRGSGDTVHYPGLGGKWTMAMALLKGDWGALKLLPRMLRKRAQIRTIRRLSPGDVRRLILAHRLTLRETT